MLIPRTSVQCMALRESERNILKNVLIQNFRTINYRIGKVTICEKYEKFIGLHNGLLIQLHLLLGLPGVRASVERR